MPITPGTSSFGSAFFCLAGFSCLAFLAGFSSASFSTSMRGKSCSGSPTLRPAGTPPHDSMSSIWTSLNACGRLSCFQMRSAVTGMNGEISTLMTRRDSAKLYMTLASSCFLAGSLARAHGVVSSMYLFARLMNAQTFLIVAESCISCMFFVKKSTVSLASALSDLSTSLSPCGASRTPSWNLMVMLSVRCSRLPRSFARSLLMRWIRASREKLPSWPRLISRNRK